MSHQNLTLCLMLGFENYMTDHTDPIVAFTMPALAFISSLSSNITYWYVTPALHFTHDVKS
jgi:ribosome-binding factor A